MQATTNVFIVYAREDLQYKKKLLSHLEPLIAPYHLVIWHDDHLEAGQEWRPHIESRLEQTQVFVLLVSVHFLNSTFIKQVEFQYAIDRHRAGKSIVIPVILKECQWDVPLSLKEGSFNLNELQILPKEGKPIPNWKTTDQAYNNIALGIRRVLETLKEQGTQSKIVDSPLKVIEPEDKNLIVPEPEPQPKTDVLPVSDVKIVRPEIKKDKDPVENITEVDVEPVINENKQVEPEPAVIPAEPIHINHPGGLDKPDAVVPKPELITVVKNDKTEDPDPVKPGSFLKVLIYLTYAGSLVKFASAFWIYANPERSGGIFPYVIVSPERYHFTSLLFLTSGALCLYGATRMRKFYKQGYFYYLGGELIPFLFVAQIVLFGNSEFLFVPHILFGILAALGLIAGFTKQKKYLTK